ncbi:MAG: hypothetical protein OXG35_10810 [Acidobacteria bacterium]|nr:hypothetical protein [Acidobacteriota bacterium]
MELYTAIAATVGAVTGMIGAAAGLWNSYQFSVLKGRVDEISSLQHSMVRERNGSVAALQR